jgi:hypothetical protein
MERNSCCSCEAAFRCASPCAAQRPDRLVDLADLLLPSLGEIVERARFLLMPLDGCARGLRLLA